MAVYLTWNLWAEWLFEADPGTRFKMKLVGNKGVSTVACTSLSDWDSGFLFVYTVICL